MDETMAMLPDNYQQVVNDIKDGIIRSDADANQCAAGSMLPSICDTRRPPGRRLFSSSLSSVVAITSYSIIAIIVLALAGASFLTIVEASSRIQTTANTQSKAALNYLLFSNEKDTSINSSDTRNLEQLLIDSEHNHASDRINLHLANVAWRKMHQNAIDYAQHRIRFARPTINRFLENSNVSSTCQQSLNDVMDHIGKLDQWAVQMYNAFGEFPAVGFFEGTLTSMGSYHQCVGIKPNEWIDRAQFCTYKFQPIIPKRPRYHNMLASIENLANFTKEDDMFHLLASKAQYFYYTKFRLGTCMPTKCSHSDLEQIGRQVALNTYLQYSGMSCLNKTDAFNPDTAQIFAFSILIGLASISFLGTLVHVLNIKSLFETVDSKDLTNYNKGHLNTNQANAMQRQALLVGNQQKSSILPAPVIQSTSSSTNISMNSSRKRPLSLRICNVLTHFSIVKNAKKLFDTSTSRRSKSQANSLAPEMKEPSSSGSSSSSQSESSSVDVSGNRSYDIGCVHGLRFWTISWIIFGHTMQYTEWAGFGRAYQVEENIVSFWLHPFLNATFSVDTFFLISGLLTTYVTWTITRGQYYRFNKFAYLISRYLRLTPQVLLVILMFIVYPLMGDGPYWKGLIQKESDNCKQNWWVSALFLQSFVRQDKICNLVTWWLSIEMLYHLVSIIVIIALLHSTRKGVAAAFLIGGGFTSVSCYLHYSNHYPPNMLPTLLQRYEIWDSIVLKYFWTPYPHAPAYFVGLLLGYVLYSRSISQLSRAQVRLGWIAFTTCYLSILFGTYNWNRNAPYSRIMSTLYYNSSQVLWAFATGWAILACALGHGGWLNKFLSASIFIPLGRATYMTYLSHMIIVMSYPAKMNMLIEPSYTVFLYIFIANLFLSYAFGIFLTLVYESPILHLQKLLVASMAQTLNDNPPKLGLVTKKNVSEYQLSTPNNNRCQSPPPPTLSPLDDKCIDTRQTAPSA